MKFLTCEINHVKNPMYARLLAAWENSVKANMPGTEYEKAFLDPKDFPQCRHPRNSYLANSVKLNYWLQRVKEENQDLCLIDGDTVVLKDVSHVFDRDFDIAYTRRTKGIQLPINGGVLFLRPSERVTEFFEKWVLTNNEMLTNQALHRTYYRKYAGINQASFGYMLENRLRLKHRLEIIELPCSEYNACDRPDWINFGEHVKILHAKSELRLCCLGQVNVKQYQKAVDEWRKYGK